MANVTDSSSLLVVPSGWSDGVLGSLKPDDGSGDFTFSRGSDLSATRVNEDGYIEKGYENLLLQSNSFDTGWTTSGTVLPNQEGYDGSNDAWLFESPTTFMNIGQNVNISGVQTYSVYAKAGTTDWIHIRLLGSAVIYTAFDLNPSTTGSRIGANVNTIDANIEDVGNGWFRCSLSANNTTNTARIYIARDNSTTINVGDNIYIQDAMINQGLSAYPYIETTATTAKAATISEDQPRVDYTSGNGAVLIEPSRTNFIGYSEAIEFGIDSLNECTQTITNETNPSGNDASYLASAIIDNNDQMRYQESGLSGSYFLSVFAKGDGNANRIRMRGTGVGVTAGNVYWDVAADGTISLNTSQSPSGVNAITEYYGNGWYRIGFEVTFDGTGRFALYPSEGDVNASTYFWGIQWEAGSHATSYIPTHGTSSTRAKDTATLTKSVASTGTIYININSDSAKTLTFLGGNVSVTQGVNKIAMAYSPTALKISHNGTIVQNITRTFDTSALTQIQLGHRNNFEQATDSINQFLTLDSFLTDTKLNELTA